MHLVGEGVNGYLVVEKDADSQKLADVRFFQAR